MKSYGVYGFMINNMSLDKAKQNNPVFPLTCLLLGSVGRSAFFYEKYADIHF
jgi:hypothetical protein